MHACTLSLLFWTLYCSLGYPCPMNFNPADYFVHTLAIVPGDEENCKDRVKVYEADNYQPTTGSRQLFHSIKYSFSAVSQLVNNSIKELIRQACNLNCYYCHCRHYKTNFFNLCWPCVGNLWCVQWTSSRSSQRRKWIQQTGWEIRLVGGGYVGTWQVSFILIARQ